MTTTYSEFKELESSLNSTLSSFIKAVFSQQISKTSDIYTIGYGSNWRDESELHPSVMDEFGIKVFLIDKIRTDYPMSILFVLTGKLGGVFLKHNLPPFLMAELKNNEDDFFTFENHEDLSSISSCLPLFLNDRSKEFLEKLIHDINKELLFTTIKFS